MSGPDPILLDFPDSFETERLLIRSPRPGDGGSLRDALADSLPELQQWLPWANAPLASLEECEANCRRAYYQFKAREDLRLHLYLKGTNVQIGGSGLHRIDWTVPRFEIGYWLRTPYVGQGYMTEAVAGITEFAFATLGARRVEIMCDALNGRSAAIPPRVGFTLEGRLRNHKLDGQTGRLRDTLVFSRIDSDPPHESSPPTHG